MGVLERGMEDNAASARVVAAASVGRAALLDNFIIAEGEYTMSAGSATVAVAALTLSTPVHVGMIVSTPSNAGAHFPSVVSAGSAFKVISSNGADASRAHYVVLEGVG